MTPVGSRIELENFFVSTRRPYKKDSREMIKSTNRRVSDCYQCGNEVVRWYGRDGKYCSQVCKVEWTWQNVTKRNIIEGTMSINNLPPFRKFLTERDGYKCLDCGISEWRGKPITLHIDHIDGDRTNNKGSNLRFACPNCHSQYPTTHTHKKR